MLVALWAAALLFAFVNGVASLRRVIVLSQPQGTDPDGQATRSFASFLLCQTQPDTRVLLLLRHGDNTAPWFNYRLNYLAYPRRPDVAWDNFPPPTSDYDLVIAYRSAQKLPHPGWIRRLQQGNASLYTPQTPPAGTVLPLPLGPLSHAVGEGEKQFPGIGCLAAGLLSIAAVVVLGFLLLSVTLPSQPMFPVWWANLALAYLVGAAALAWITLLSALLTGRLLLWPTYLAALALLPFARRGRARSVPANDEMPVTSSVAWPVTLALAGVLLLGIGMALECGWRRDLEWDGWAIWQFKAKAYALDGNLMLLRDTTHFRYTHSDYPPLVSLLTWWTYAHLGRVNDSWAQALNFLFYLDLLALFAAFARRYVAPSAALAGTALLASLPVATTQAVSGLADLPMAAYLLGLAGCLAVIVRPSPRSSLSHAVRAGEKASALAPALVWMCAGIVLVKNEGLLACLGGLAILGLGCRQKPLLSASRGVEETGLRRAQRLRRAFALCLVAALGAYLPWLVLKRVWHLTSDLFVIDSSNPFFARLTWARLIFALHGFAAQIARVGPWYPCWGLLALLFPVGALVAFRRRVLVSTPLWLLAGWQLLGYIAIYVLTPHDQGWHVGSSVARLTLHLVPTLLLAALWGCFAKPESRR